MTVVAFRPRQPAKLQLLRSLADLDAAQAARVRVLQLLAERTKLVDATVDRFRSKTAADIHYAEEDLAAWDRAHGAELERLEAGE